jgi:hypothetical protein
MQLDVLELACWLPSGLVVGLVATLFVNAAARKLLIKNTSAMTTKRRSTNCDLLLAVFIIITR